MKHKRLSRDGWGFEHYPYYQMRIDDALFHGTACLIRLTDGDAYYWSLPKSGRIQVTGGGMTWLELIPDGTHRVVTVKYYPDDSHDPERRAYPEAFQTKFRPSVWYVDVIEEIETDPDGILVYVDKYLDVIFTPEGDVKIDDRDELDAAYATGELTREQYEAALAEGERILADYCADIYKTHEWCSAVRRLVEDRIAAGEQEHRKGSL